MPDVFTRETSSNYIKGDLSVNTAIISNFPPNTLMETLPASLAASTVFSFHTEKSSKTREFLPYHWESFVFLFETFDEIVVVGELTSNDEMLQGSKENIMELTLILLTNFSRKYKKRVMIHTKNGLFPLGEIKDIQAEHPVSNPYHSSSSHTVSSIQKIPLPKTFHDNLVVHYFNWLQRASKGIIKVIDEHPVYSFYVKGISRPLLTFQENPRGNLYWMSELTISGGFLNKETSLSSSAGRFWFVRSDDGKHLYTLLIHFKPTLPWIIYRMSQGLIHPLVMKSYRKFIRKTVPNKK